MSQEPVTDTQHFDDEEENVLGTIIGWGILGLFAIGFAWYVGAPLIIGERWANKKEDAINLVKNSKPLDDRSLYDMIRAYSLRAKDKDIYVGEFSWDALQREGPQYEVTLLWTEGSSKKVAIWRVNLEESSVRPQGNEATGLPAKVSAGP